MGSEQKIIDKILEDAQLEAQAIVQQAQAKADAMIQEAQTKAEKELAQYEKLSEAEAEKAAAKEISGAEMQAKKQVLSTKQELLEKALKEAERILYHLEKEDYKKIISSMLDNAQGTEKGEIIFSAKDRDTLMSVAEQKNMKVSSETRDIAGGFIVKEGEVEFNYSFESIISVERENIELTAAQILFG